MKSSQSDLAQIQDHLQNLSQDELQLHQNIVEHAEITLKETKIEDE
jgi:hypothetical protein